MLHPQQVQWKPPREAIETLRQKNRAGAVDRPGLCRGALFLYVAWRAIITFLFAIFFAYILEAPISKLQKWLKGSRPAAIAVVYLLFAALLIVTLSLLGPPVMDEAQKLMQQAPELGAKSQFRRA